MSTSLSPVNGKQTILDQGSFEFWETTEHGIAFKDNTPQDVWLDAVKQITTMYESSGRLHCRAMFILADGLNEGERLYGEKWSQAIEDTRAFIRLHDKTIRNSMWVAKKIASPRRHEMLTLTHHEIVASLPDKEQEAFLAMAEHDGLNTKELKEKVREKHPGKTRQSKNGSKPNKSTPTITNATEAKAAATQLSNYLTENEDKIDDKWKPFLEHMHKLFRRKWQNGRARR